MTEEVIKRLLEKYLVEELSGEEFRQLWASLQQPQNKELWMGLAGEVWNNAAFHGLSDEASRKEALERILATGAVPDIQVARLVQGDTAGQKVHAVQADADQEAPAVQKPPIRLFANSNRGW